MAKIVKPTNYEPLPEGPIHAVIFAANDSGEQPGFDEGDSCWQYVLGLEFPTELSRDGKPRAMWIVANAKLHEKSKLGEIAAACGVTVDPAVGLDPVELRGKNLTVTNKETDKNGRTYSNITGYSKLGKGIQPVQPVRPADEPMPDWLQRKLAQRMDKEAVDGSW